MSRKDFNILKRMSSTGCGSFDHLEITIKAKVLRDISWFIELTCSPEPIDQKYENKSNELQCIIMIYLSLRCMKYSISLLYLETSGVFWCSFN